MSNDPKDAIVDLSKMTTVQQITSPQPIQTSRRPTLTVQCNESLNGSKIDSTTNSQFTGHETFNKNTESKK